MISKYFLCNKNFFLMVGQNNFRNKIPVFFATGPQLFSLLSLGVFYYYYIFVDISKTSKCLRPAWNSLFWLRHNNVFWIFVGHLVNDTKVRCRGNLLTNSGQPRSVQPQIVIHCHLKRLYWSLEDWKLFQSCLEFLFGYQNYAVLT